MRLRLALASVALSVLSSSALAAPRAVKGMWDGYDVGSWISMKAISKMEMGGNAMPPTETESRQTLVKVTDDEWTLKNETKVGAEWTNAVEFTIPRKAPPGTEKDAPKPEDLGSESVSVEGKDYPCKKERKVEFGMTTTSWNHETHGPLKTQSEGNGTSTSWIVTSLSKKVKVGDKELVCMETKAVSKMAGAGETTTIALTSEDVPMRTVRSETTNSSEQMKMSSVTELTGWEKK